LLRFELVQRLLQLAVQVRLVAHQTFQSRADP
jgi:hypothetical protein